VDIINKVSKIYDVEKWAAERHRVAMFMFESNTKIIYEFIFI
jgi:hypothetical protein